jgi:polyhydroxyalkanoate synthesis regulator phasin
MITRQEWDQKSDQDKFEYLRWHSETTERAVDQLTSAIQQLREQVAKLQSQHPDSAA